MTVVSTKQMHTRGEYGPLLLPDGRDARSLRWADLMRELSPILPDVPSSAGKHELLRRYSNHLSAKAAETEDAA